MVNWWCRYYQYQETGFYYLQTRYYDAETGRFINADTFATTDIDGLLSTNMFSYCENNPVMHSDPNGEFLISTAILIGAIVGGAVGAVAGGVSFYKTAKREGAEGWKLAGKTAIGAIAGGTIGAAVGAAVGYCIGYLAGGTYANGLAAKSINRAVKAFTSQPNKVHHVLCKTGHNLSGYTSKTIQTLMRKTLINGTVSPYKGVRSAYWAMKNSEGTFTIIKGVIKISDMWIR